MRADYQDHAAHALRRLVGGYVFGEPDGRTQLQ